MAEILPTRDVIEVVRAYCDRVYGSPPCNYPACPFIACEPDIKAALQESIPHPQTDDER